MVEPPGFGEYKLFEPDWGKTLSPRASKGTGRLIVH
jgi:hypothetical protein